MLSPGAHLPTLPVIPFSLLTSPEVLLRAPLFFLWNYFFDFDFFFKIIPLELFFFLLPEEENKINLCFLMII